MDQQIAIVLICLCSTIGVFVGSIISPSSRMKSKEIQYWRGLTGDFKKQLKAEKGGNDGGLGDLLAGDFSIGTLIKLVKDNPDLIKTLGATVQSFKTQSQQSKLPDYNNNTRERSR